MSTDKIKQENIVSFIFVVSFFLLLGFVGFAQTGVGINTTTPKSDFEVNGSFAKKVTVVETTSITLDETHSIVVCNNATTPITLTLPAISTCVGRIYTIKKGNSTTDVTIDANLAEKIDGVETMVLSDAKIAITLFNNGMEWQATANYDAQFPMGEVSYFNTAGTNIGITLQSDGSTNMVVCRPTTTLLNRGEFGNGGANGRLQYTGKNSKIFHIACTISGTSASGSTGKTYVFGIAQSDVVKTSAKVLNRFASSTDIQSTSLHVMLTLAPNDYLEFFVGNTTDAIDFKFVSLNLVAIGMPD